MQEVVFINCMAEDSPHLEVIKERLDVAGLPYYIQPAQLNPVLQEQMVEKIRSISAAHGCMVCILSRKAVSNSLFISNIQLMCEAAGNNRVLVHYTVEQLENDQSIRLFDSQAYQVKNTGNSSEDASLIIQRINQTIHPPARDILQIITRIISRKVLTWLMIAVAVMAVAASVLFNYSHKAPPVPSLATPTPVLLYVPFSGQSQDAGLRVDVQNVPENKPSTDPAVEAPFAFKPAFIFMQDDFNNPAFDHSFDGKKWTNNYNRLESAPGVAMSQTNGVLQLAVAPTGEQQTYLGLGSKFMFNPHQVAYLGYRFRLNDYQGKIQENTFISGNFTYQFNDSPDISNIQLDGLSQKLQFNKSEIDLGSSWHTIEMVSQKDRHFVDMYLDGKKINTLSFTDAQFDRWMHATFALYASKTTDWVSLQFDDIIFGGDDPIAQPLQPDDAPYRFAPDTVALQEDFNTQLPQEVLNNDGEFVTQSGGVLSFRIPAGQDRRGIKLLFPTGPINQDNYYAIRFRFTSPDDEIWSDYASFYLGVINLNQFQKSDAKNVYNLDIGTYRHELAFFGRYGISDGMPGWPFEQNQPPASWHTLELIIKPPNGASQAYTAFFWVDGFLLGEGNMQQDPAALLDANAPLRALIMIDSGSYRQNIFSGDIENMVIGTIASDKIKE